MLLYELWKTRNIYITSIKHMFFTWLMWFCPTEIRCLDVTISVNNYNLSSPDISWYTFIPKLHWHFQGKDTIKTNINNPFQIASLPSIRKNWQYKFKKLNLSISNVQNTDYKPLISTSQPPINPINLKIDFQQLSTYINSCVYGYL